MIRWQPVMKPLMLMLRMWFIIVPSFAGFAECPAIVAIEWPLDELVPFQGRLEPAVRPQGSGDGDCR